METIKKVWKWIKDHIVLIGVGIVSTITLCDYYIHRRADERTAVWGYRDRIADAERLSNRSERTAEIQSEFIDDCERRLEQCEEDIRAAEDTADRISESNITAEQALAELRRRFTEDQDKK